ncbi:hypothetical protein B5S33_g1015 [[Candida] boidinii]|nr:hypothetical protein B5S30_g1037 [[Candida] boidinii]OWB82390.1 hypothetical protein B5S33_g1015 [[Candida] boidinii]
MSTAFRRFLNSETALFATGAIWTRWSFVIIPKNYLLASVNFFLGGVAGYQIIRIFNWRRTLGDTPAESFKYIVNGTPEDSKKKEITETPASK